jgi:hypothetical protein
MDGLTVYMATLPAGLLDVVTAMPDMPNAGCRDEWSTFDAAPYDKNAQLAALNICARCPHLAPCRQWVDTLNPADLQPHAVVAGQIVPAIRRRNRHSDVS